MMFPVAVRRDSSRLNWLTFIKNDMSLPSGNESGGEEFGEILEFCLRETKRPDICILAARVATLAVLWDLDVDESVVEECLLELLRVWKRRGDYLMTLLACLVCVVVTSDKTSSKVILSLLKDEICPIIEEASDKVVAEMTGEVVDEEDSDSDSDAEPLPGDYLIELMEAWQACVAVISEDGMKEQVKEMTSVFHQLLDHSVDAVRVAAAHCILSIVDLCERHHEIVGESMEEEMADIVKTLARVTYSNDFDWGDGNSRKTFEQVGELIKDKSTVVTVELMSVTANPVRGHNVTGNTYRFYEANANKRGHPVAGYADAAVVEFFHSHLGHHFADLFSINNPHKYRNNDRAYHAMFKILTRHPASKNAALHIEGLRSYGAGSFSPGRFLVDPGYERPRKHKPVRVSDYL